MDWINFEVEHPHHKQLVLVCDGDYVLPAIFYSNQSFNGFWKFTTYYENTNSHYKKVKLKQYHEIKGVIKWMPFPKN